MPKNLIGNIGGAYLKDSKSVVFQPTQCEALDSLTKYMTSGYVSYLFLNRNVYKLLLLNYF